MIIHHPSATEERRPRHRAGYYQCWVERGSFFNWCFCLVDIHVKPLTQNLIFFFQPTKAEEELKEINLPHEDHQREAEEPKTERL